MSWASIAKAAPQPVVAAQDLALRTDGLRLLVVDANAIISGIKLEGFADKAVTVQEVLDEIRDKQSRQFLSSLPYHLQVSEPTEESIKIVTRFARETGDVAALSTNDIKVLALAHTLEVAAHGSEHLAIHAAQPRMHSKHISSSQAMPGWGTVPNPEDWKVVDEANEADEAAAASMSRIAQHVQQLSLDPSEPNSFLEDATTSATDAPAAAGNPSSQQQAAVSIASANPAQQQQQQQQQQAPSGAWSAADGVAAAAAAAAAAGTNGGENDDDGGWEVAASSQAAARRKRRKEYKRQEKQAAFEAEWEDHARIVQQQQQLLLQQQQGPAAGPAGQQQQQVQQQDGLQVAVEPLAAAAATEGDDACSEHAEDDDGESEEADAEGEGVTNDELLAAEHQVYTADEVGSTEAEEDSDNAPSSTAAEPSSSSSSHHQQQQQVLAPGMPGWQSSIACITADFAMQNVLLQMGLRLLTRDGRRIARLSRYALRCSACFNVTREPGRIFCPKCGNMTLDRVEVVVGPDGTEYFGVKKRHVLRGTKYSLPKPRGGRNSKDPVLREDIFLLKVKALGRRAAKKKAAAKAGDDAAAAAAANSVDPFAPEYNQHTWHVASQAELAQHRGLAAVLQPAWKNNPNERKLTRSNRRG